MTDTRKGSTWIRPTSRWAIYLRDGMTCVYCQRTALDILRGADDNFLTLDHVQLRSQGGGHGPENLVTACYHCNQARGESSLQTWCLSRGWGYAAVRSRVYAARRRDPAPYHEAARVLLGQVPGVPRADIAIIMAWRARRQWAGWQERLEWVMDLETCSNCHRRIKDDGAAPPELEAEGPVPF